MARILLVDDEHNIRLMVSLALRHVGHEVETASDGVEAIEKFADGRSWDLVLLDQRMPGPQGLEVLRTMRQTDPNCRVIIITAYGTVELAREAVELGARDLLRKPFTTEMLRGVVDAIMSEDPRLYPSAMAVNGFRLIPVGVRGEAGGQVRVEFTVRTPSGAMETCLAEIPAALVEQVRDYVAAGQGEIIAGVSPVVWQALGEDLLANYLWQNADLPSNGLLVADELTGRMRRRLDSFCSGVCGTEATAGMAAGGPEDDGRGEFRPCA